jgi:hypothetical protein
VSIRALLRVASYLLPFVILAPMSLRADQHTPGAAAEAGAHLTPEEKAERTSREACKISICGALHNRKAVGGDIACKLTKTWRKEQAETFVSKAKMSWPWGRVKCVADIGLKRDMLNRAMTESKFEAVLDPHSVACEVERDKGMANIKFDVTPRVAFEHGKAVRAAVNWGRIAAPALMKGAMWAAAATDNAFNVLEPTLVRDINDFIEKKCLEVKNEWLRR